MLKFNKDWEYEPPSAIPAEVRADFYKHIVRIASKGGQKSILEHFKDHFAAAAGTTAGSSSSVSWAASDQENYIDDVADNAPLFIDAFYTACDLLRRGDPDLPIPDIDRINQILAKHEVGLQILDGHLVATTAVASVTVPDKSPSMDEQVQELITQSLDTAQAALDKGQGRQAVTELLWLLETITTAFKGAQTTGGSIQAKYFNTIIREMRASARGNHQKQIFDWMTALHGFLSSTTGGGIRHGRDLKEGVAVELTEAKLYCNLIRSYILYLLDEHARLNRT